MNEIRPVYRIEKTVMPGTLDGQDIFIKIEFSNKKLSISGTCKNSSGQIDSDLRKDLDKIKFKQPFGFWTKEKLNKLLRIWEEYHLNDLEPACEHQRELKWKDIRIDPAELPSSIANRDEKGILASWVYEKDHPKGFLCKPCPTCGYKYGSAWLTREVPADVLVWLDNLETFALDGSSASEHKANTFLKNTKANLKIEFLRNAKYFDDDEHPRDIYSVTISRGDRSFSFEFGQSYNDSGRWWRFGRYERGTHPGIGKNNSKPTPANEWDKNVNFSAPNAYDILASIEKYHPGTLEQFCSEFGYDLDSKKAEKIYNAVIDQVQNIRKTLLIKRDRRAGRYPIGGSQMFKLVWKKEVIETDIATREEAEYLKKEYNMAYNGGVTIEEE